MRQTLFAAAVFGLVSGSFVPINVTALTLSPTHFYAGGHSRALTASHRTWDRSHQKPVTDRALSSRPS
jgi:hypothetical protein